MIVRTIFYTGNGGKEYEDTTSLPMKEWITLHNRYRGADINDKDMMNSETQALWEDEDDFLVIETEV
jgi:hypothetical protein|tara:strand:- start:164 stop:364 length:201 start_codon:yes stop_codon:yes gene_type:complete